MKALVISGGGSKGAFAGGVAEYLIRDCQTRYDMFVGVSTGSLLVPFLALDQIDAIRKIYTKVTLEDVFSVSPLKVKRRHGITRARIHHLNVIRQFMRRKQTFGDSSALRDLIDRHYSLKMHQQLQDMHQEVILGVSNLSMHQVEYKCQHEYNREDFRDWMWASANMVPFMSLHHKDGMAYADGNIGTNLPLQEAINRGATEIDAIVLRPREQLVNYSPPSNAFTLMLNMFDFSMNQISRSDVALARCESRFRKVSVNFYFTPFILTENALLFDPEKMERWWILGREYANQRNPYSIQIKPEG
ncbi:MAG: patatin-like phospholipase family protein [Bacteroidota bacterium]